MNSKQEYYKAFSALLSVRKQFVDQVSMKLYAYHGLYYYFNDEALVKAGFLSSFSDQEKNTIYSDPNFGLNNVGGLYYWFKAAQNSTDSLSMYYRKAIMVYFTSKNVKMS